MSLREQSQADHPKSQESSTPPRLLLLRHSKRPTSKNLLPLERMDPSPPCLPWTNSEIHPSANEVRERKQPSPSPSPSPTKRARLDASSSSSFPISEAGGLEEGAKGSTSGWLKRSNPLGVSEKKEEKGIDLVSFTGSHCPLSPPLPSPSDPFLTLLC